MPSNPPENTKKEPKFEEFQIPEIGTSPVTGLPGNPQWGAINKPSLSSRWTIGDMDSDDEFNWLPMGGYKLQLPGPSATIATLASPLIWLTSFYFNAGTFLFALCQNGNVYQISAAGVITTVGTGFTTVGVVDIACWQGTTIIISDSAAQKVFSWNGTTLTTVFTTQPVQYIAIFQNRLWMCQNSTVQWTSVNTFNSLAGDSGSYLITDHNAHTPILVAVDTPYGLLIGGSNWFKTITNLTDIGVPAVLTFQQNTIESQVGVLSKWTVLTIGNTVFFANAYGVWAFQGSQPIQISAPFLNGYFSNLDFTKTSLSAAYGVINGTPCFFCQAYFNGDTQVAAGYTIFGYTLQGTQWFRYVNGTVKWITGLVSQGSSNQVPVIWGSDGTNIFTLFTNTTAVMSSQWNSKLWPLGSVLDLDNVLGVAVEFIVNSPATITVTQIDESNEAGFRARTQSFVPGGIVIINLRGQVITIINATAVAPTISVVQSAVTSVGTAASISQAFGSNTTAGNMLVVLMSVSDATSITNITDTAGNTFSPIRNDGNGYLIWAVLNALGGADTVTVNFSSAQFADLFVIEVNATGSATWSQDGTGAFKTGTGTNLSTGLITAMASDYLVSFAQAAQQAITPGFGWTQRQISGFSNLVMDQIANASGAYSANATVATSQNWTINIAALHASPPGGSGVINIVGSFLQQWVLFQDDGEGRARRVGLNVNVSGFGCALTSVILIIHRTGAGRGS